MRVEFIFAIGEEVRIIRITGFDYVAERAATNLIGLGLLLRRRFVWSIKLCKFRIRQLSGLILC